MPFLTSFLSSDIFYSTAGVPSLSKPAILFIHGLGSSQNYYYPQLEALSQSHYLVLFDTPGSGQSPLPSASPTAASLIADIANLLDHLSISAVVVVGHSLGGLLATLFAIHRQDLVAGLVLLGPVHPSPTLAAAFATRIKTIQDAGFSLEAIYDTVPKAATGSRASSLVHGFIRELISRQDPRGYISTCSVIAEAPSPDFSLLKDKKPAIVLVGSEDKTAPFEGCVEIIAKGLDAEVRRLDGVGHWHALEDPDIVADAIRDVYSKVV
ncbi:3-oxoadipate enol-lactone hydrolase [Kockiozyma suomiensis]|uniref:3-oxoadipate enol-lactone hydrolase n=1 Tax=Kockiozyma suomiensis TaxID=1337062 RepID=UPI003343D29B